MLKYFVCPDGERTTIKDCWEACRLGSRCLTLPTLVEVGTDREWTGEASTTQLLNGTMYEYLRLNHDYAINPRSDRAFALLGTAHHKLLEGRAQELGLPSEISLTGDGRNVFDLLEREGDAYVLTDYKTWGAFKVAKTFGIVVVNEYKETYKDKAGRERTRTIKERAEIPERGDWFDVSMQLGRYAYTVAEKANIPIARIQVQVTVRDGGLKSAQYYGVTDNMYMREVPMPPKQEVDDYFTWKQERLQAALGGVDEPDMCTEDECWDGIRCARFCEVATFCPKGRQERMIHARHS